MSDGLGETKVLSERLSVSGWQRFVAFVKARRVLVIAVVAVVVVGLVGGAVAVFGLDHGSSVPVAKTGVSVSATPTPSVSASKSPTPTPTPTPSPSVVASSSAPVETQAPVEAVEQPVAQADTNNGGAGYADAGGYEAPVVQEYVEPAPATVPAVEYEEPVADAPYLPEPQWYSEPYVDPCPTSLGPSYQKEDGTWWTQWSDGVERQDNTGVGFQC